MRQDPNLLAVERAAPTHADAQPANNTAAAVTLTAVENERHVISEITVSYDGAPTGGNLLVTDGGSTIFSCDIIAGGPTQLTFRHGLVGSVNSEVVITLAAAGASVAGKLNVTHH